MDNSFETTILGIRDALRSLRIPATPGEYDLHALIGEALGRAGFDVRHEAVIAPRCRIDFLVGCVGIEVKQGKQRGGALRTQISRYLKSDKLEALIVVTTRGVSVPASVGNKPVEVIGLNRLWGVSLP